MLKIGDFSKLSRVTVKTLRYYDEIGLLRSASVDDVNGYRYYTVDQLPRLNRILALKDLGFSLEQIAMLLAEDLPASQIRGMLRLRLSEIESRMQEERARLMQVEARLRQIEQEGKMSEYEVVVKNVEPQWVASIREQLRSYQDIGRLYGEIYPYVGRNRGQAGVCGALWHDPGYKETDIDGEAYVALSKPIQGSDRVKVYELPAAQVASTVHRGSYGAFPQAYAAIVNWINGNGYQIAGANREIYLKPGKGQDDESCVTEIQFPIEKTAA